MLCRLAEGIQPVGDSSNAASALMVHSPDTCAHHPSIVALSSTPPPPMPSTRFPFAGD